MPIIDAHTHAWGPPSSDHPWTNGSIVQRVDNFDVDPLYTAEKLLGDMDRLCIDEAVIVGYPIVEWTDNWYTLQAAADHDRLYGIVMLDHFGPDAAERARTTLNAPGVIGLRISPGQVYDRMWQGGGGTAEWFEDAIEQAAFWEAVAEANAIVTIAGIDDHLDEVARLIERYPDLRYLFDGYGPLGADSSASDRERFEAFASFENVGVKASHTPFISAKGFPYTDVHELLYWLVDTVGPERVVWGSDFPNVTGHEDGVTYAEALNWIHHADGLSAKERRAIKGESLAGMIREAGTGPTNPKTQ